MHPAEFIATHGYAGIAALTEKRAPNLVVVNKGRAIGPTSAEARPACCIHSEPVTAAQHEYEFMRWRGWRRLVGGEAFFFKWRSEGGAMP